MERPNPYQLDNAGVKKPDPQQAPQEGGNGTRGIPPTIHERSKPPPKSEASSTPPEHKRGRSHSPETRAKMSHTRKGKSHSPEHRAHISEALTGRVLSPKGDCLKTSLEACWQVDTFAGHLAGAQLPQNNMITSV